MVLREALSPRTAGLHSRARGAERRAALCPYCAIGCGLEVLLRDGQAAGIEGNAASPVNRGRLCPKGANALQLFFNPRRLTRMLYRAPHSSHWEERPLDWALGRIARLVKETRDRGFVERDAEGRRLNHVKSIATLGGSACDNEENYLIKKLFTGGLGVLPVENQARL